MKVAFVGSMKGVTDQQKDALRNILDMLGCCNGNEEDNWLMHSDLIGADETAHAVAKSLGYRTIATPGDIEEFRAHTASDIVMDPAKPVTQNRKRVDDGAFLIACPLGYNELQRSSTWATVRYARHQGKHSILIWPDGVITTE